MFSDITDSENGAIVFRVGLEVSSTDSSWTHSHFCVVLVDSCEAHVTSERREFGKTGAGGSLNSLLKGALLNRFQGEYCSLAVIVLAVLSELPRP